MRDGAVHEIAMVRALLKETKYDVKGSVEDAILPHDIIEWADLDLDLDCVRRCLTQVMYHWGEILDPLNVVTVLDNVDVQILRMSLDLRQSLVDFC